MGWRRSARSSTACGRWRPAGQSGLDQAVLQRLEELTQGLIAVKEGAAEEHARFPWHWPGAGLCLPEAQLSAWLSGATVLVTGGDRLYWFHPDGPDSGARAPGRLVGVSRGIADGWPTQATAEYRQADVRGPGRPGGADPRGGSRDVIFHVRRAARAPHGPR